MRKTIFAAVMVLASALAQSATIYEFSGRVIAVNEFGHEDAIPFDAGALIRGIINWHPELSGPMQGGNCTGPGVVDYSMIVGSTAIHSDRSIDTCVYSDGSIMFNDWLPRQDGSINGFLDDAEFRFGPTDVERVNGFPIELPEGRARIAVQVVAPSVGWISDVEVHSVPEPGTAPLMLTGVLAIGYWIRKRRAGDIRAIAVSRS